MSVIWLILFSCIGAQSIGQNLQRIPKSESSVKGLDLSINKVNYLHQNYLQLNGASFNVSLKEFLFDTTDIDRRCFKT